MKKNYFAFLILIFATLGLTAQTTLLEYNFDNYTAGDKLVEQAGDPWDTWSSSPGGSEDPIVSADQSSTPDNSVNILAGNDCVLLLGDSTSGRYKISFTAFIPTGSLGYFNVLQDFAGTNSKWGTQTYFDLNGVGRTDGGGADAGVFEYNYDEWILLETYVDLDNDWAEFFVNGEFVVEWKWSGGSFGDGTLNQLGAVNFYAWDEGGTPDFYFDDVLFETMPLLDAPTNLVAEVDGTDVSLTWDAPASRALTAYYVFRNNQLIATTDETSYNEVLDYPGNHTYYVKAYYDPNGLSQSSNSVDVVIEGGSDREMVLLEIATGTWCGFCPGAALGADDLVESGADATVIEYHNGDVFATAQSDERNSYYAVSGYPTSTFGGISGFSGGDASNSIYDAYVPYYEERIAKKSIFGLVVDVNLSSRAYTFDVSVDLEQQWDYTSSDLVLHTVLTESHIPHNWLGLDEVNFVCRDMYPSAFGEELSLANNGDTESFNFEVEVSDDYDITHCELVVFIQDNDTKEILNATMVHLGQIVGVAEMGEQYSRIYPNPTTDQVTIESQSVLKNVSIYTLAGQKVYELALDQNNVNLNIDFLETGIYMIRLETENGTKIEKLNVR